MVNVLSASAPADRLHQLRPPVADFTGREPEITELLAQIRPGGGATIAGNPRLGGIPGLGGVHGLGGIGKTELALVVAQRLAPEYEDAQLYLDLKGTADLAKGERPLTAADAMAHVICAFAPDVRLPESDAQVRDLYLSSLHGKRVLLLMDNAADAAQVEPLIPPAGCVLLVTSRQNFALPGLHPLRLDTLPPEKARELLAAITPRVGEHAAELAELCGRLPLALRVAGSALAARRNVTVPKYVAGLRDERRRLKQLGPVEASLNVSAALLDDNLRTSWLMLGVFPTDFDVAAAAAVWQVDSDAALELLTELVGRSIVEWREVTQRYWVHDLVRSYLRHRLAQAQPPHDQPTASRRFVEHYVSVARKADDTLEQKDGYVAGLALFDTDWGTIQAAFATAAALAHEQPWANAAAISLCNGCPYCLDLRLHGQAKIRWLAVGLDAARRANDRRAEGVLLGNLGIAYKNLGDARKAIEFHEQHLLIAREVGDRRGEGNALGNLGLAYAALGEARKAIEFYERRLVIARETGDRRGEARVLNNLGGAYRALGDARKAIEFYELCLVIAREIGDRCGEGKALGNLGSAHAALGDARKAIEFYEQSLVIDCETGDRGGEAITSWNAGLIYEKRGDLPRAAELMQVCVDFEREIGHADAEKDAARLAAVRERMK